MSEPELFVGAEGPDEILRMLLRSEDAPKWSAFQERHVAATLETFLGLAEIARTDHPAEASITGFLQALELLWAHPTELVDVAQSPLFHWWTSLLAELLEVVPPSPHTDLHLWVAGRDRSELLRNHLAQVALFAGAVAERVGSSFEPTEPLDAPAWLPGSSIEHLAANGEVPSTRFEGVRAGSPAWTAAPTPVEVPAATLGALRLTVHAHHPAFHARHIERWERVCSRVERLAFARALSDALVVVEQAFPMLQAHALLISHCTPMDTGGVVAMASGAYTRLQGAVFVARSNVPMLLAEMFVHEFSHTRLSLLEREHPLFVNSRRERRHYSPWRDDPRPAEGVLHALFVHAEILRLWSHHVRSGTDAGAKEEDALRRIWTLLAQLRIGVDDFRCTAEPTSFGALLLDAIDARIRQETRAWPPEECALPFFSEIKADSTLRCTPIARAVTEHRDVVMGGIR